jgi:hypothetical protein
MISFWLGLVAKMATSAAVVVTASLVVERTGPVIGALVATLPISAGPAYAFLALEHSPEFLARSTLASLAVNAGTGPFVVVYALMAQRRGVLASIGAALGLWVVEAVVLTRLSLDFPQVAVLNLVSYGTAYVLTRPYRRAPDGVRPERRWWDLPARAGTVMAIVAGVVTAGRLLGPTAAGIVALLPVVLTSLALVMHPRVGGKTTGAVLANSIPGMLGFTTGLATLHLTVVTLGAAGALLLGLAVCVAWNAGLLALNLWSMRRIPGRGRAEARR